MVDTGGINIQHLAPGHFFRGTDVPDSRQQFVEIVPAAGPLQPVAVHDKPLDDAKDVGTKSSWQSLLILKAMTITKLARLNASGYRII